MRSRGGLSRNATPPEIMTPGMTPARDHEMPDATAIRRMVDDVLAETGAAAQVSVDSGEPQPPEAPEAEVSVVPPNADAAPLHVAVDPGLAYVTVGRNDAHFEIWERRGDEPLAILREIVSAVVRGDYEEWADPGGTGVKGVFRTAGTDRWIFTNTLRVFRRAPRGWKHVRYAPYERAPR